MIILSLGSNLPSRFGDRFDNLKLAINFIETCGIIIDKKSSFYETPSYPNKSNPKFRCSISRPLKRIDIFTLLPLPINFESDLSLTL